MANPMKKTLSRNLSQMKFMKRRSHGDSEETDSGGVLTERWIIPDAPPPITRSPGLQQTNSFMECENLNRFGRFSFNNFNRDVERLMQHYAKTGDEGSLGVIEDETEAIPAHEVARRYEVIGSKKLLGKRKRQEAEESSHLEKRLSEPLGYPGKGFLKPR